MLRAIFEKIGEIQARHAYAIFFSALLLSAVIALGIPKIRLQTDLSKELPEGVPSIELQKKIGKKFGDVDAFIIVISIDRSEDAENRVIDIRDPRALKAVVELHELISKEKEVSDILSPALILSNLPEPKSIEESRAMIGSIPELRQFFNRDYTATLIFAYADLGADEERVKAFVENIERDINSVAKPSGIKISVTGTPVMRTTLLNLLIRDATITMTLAGLIILLLLIIIQRSLTKALLVFLPLVGGMLWLLGTMGWLGIPLSIATVGIGAMVLGLGVEYGIFIVRRYEEEREKGKSQEEALKKVMPGVGLAIFGSASTTTIGFLALLLATMPMIQKMGATLALGIIYSFIAAVIVNPAFIIVEENFAIRKRKSRKREQVKNEAA